MVDLFADDEFLNPLLWSVDRLHLSAAGHRRVAAHVLTTLKRGVRPAVAAGAAATRPRRRGWRPAAPTCGGPVSTWRPWIKRRLTGRSSGDTVTAKRPLLGPLTD